MSVDTRVTCHVYIHAHSAKPEYAIGNKSVCVDVGANTIMIYRDAIGAWVNAFKEIETKLNQTGDENGA